MSEPEYLSPQEPALTPIGHRIQHLGTLTSYVRLKLKEAGAEPVRVDELQLPDGGRVRFGYAHAEQYITLLKNGKEMRITLDVTQEESELPLPDELLARVTGGLASLG